MCVISAIRLYRLLCTFDFVGEVSTWHEDKERRLVTLNDLTPITLVRYRSHLQKECAAATVNVHVAALRAWCQWLVEISTYLVTVVHQYNV
jgi:hypothetical protein